MAEQATTARPYARAAFSNAIAGVAGGLDSWSTYLQRAAAIVSDARVRQLIGNPRVPSAQLAGFVDELASPATASAGAGESAPRNFLQLLSDNRRLKLLPEIAAQFEALRAEAERTADVEVISAQPISEPDAAKLRATLEQRLQRRVRLHPQVDPALVGGAVVRYGDFVVDGSMRGRIDRMAAAMSGG